MKGQGRIYRRGRIWWIGYGHRGKEYRESSGSAREADARRLLKKRLGEIHSRTFIGPEAERLTISELLDDLVANYQENGRKNIQGLKGNIKRLLKFFAADRVIDVTAKRIKRYRKERLAEEAAPATLNRELSCLRRAFSLAKEERSLNFVPTVKLLEENNVREGFVDRADFEAVARELPDHLADFSRFGFLVGWRKSEIASLAWSSVNMRERVLFLRRKHSKNRRARNLALEGALLRLLEKREALRSVERDDGTVELCPFVFHDGRGRKIGDFRKSWKSACARVGLPDLLFHDLRRCAVRNMRRSGTSETVAMMISGHRTRSVFDRYDIVDDRDIRDAVKNVQAYVEAQPLERNVERMTREGAGA